MKLDNKEFFKLSFLYTAIAALPPFLNLFVRPLIEGNDRLNPSDFSQIEISETVISLAFIIATFAMSNAISRFYYDHEDDKPNLGKLISTIFNSIILRGIGLLIIAFIFRDQIGKIFSQPALQDFPSYGYTAIGIGIFRAINMTAFALFRNNKNVRLFLILGFLLGFLRAGLQLVGVLYYDMSFIGYLNGGMIGNGIVAAIILIHVYKKYGFAYSRTLLNPANKFALPLFEYAFVLWGINFADRYFLESSPNLLGIYSQALLLGRGIEIVLQGLQGASQPEMFRLMKNGVEKNLGEIKRLSHMLMAQSNFFIAISILPAMVYCMIFKTDIKLAAGFVAIVFIRYILRTQYIIFSFPVYFEKKTSIFLYLNVAILLVNLVLLYFLVPLMGAYGAIIATLVSQAIQVMGMYIYQNKIISISWNLNKLLIFPFIIILLTSMIEVVKIQLGINIYITSSLVVVLMFGSMVILYKNEIKNIIRKGWKQF